MSRAELPELVGEAQVVADEQADPQALDRRPSRARSPARKCLLLAAERERVDLAVAVHACRRDRRARSVLYGRWSSAGAGRDLRARAADPHAVLARPARRGTATTGRPPARAMSRCVDEKPVENVSVSSDQPGARAGRGGDHRREVLEVGLAVVPHDVVLDRGDRAASLAHAAAPSAGRPPRRSRRGACRRRTARGAGRARGVRVEHLVRDRRPRRTARAASGRTPCRRRRAAAGGCRPSMKYVPSGTERPSNPAAREPGARGGRAWSPRSAASSAK